VARGYLGRPDLTAERFVELAGIGRAYRTGDVVRRHPGGALEFLGRADHQVKVRGFRVEVGEVEAHLVALPEVREAVVVARGEGPARKLVGYLVPSNAGSAPPVSAIRAALRAELPDYMVPAALVVLDAAQQGRPVQERDQVVVARQAVRRVGVELPLDRDVG
jgi:acyl-coenzyme A synthetase/AMP-(fatty) acid ligase